MATESEIIVSKLDLIQEELDYIKEHMVEKDEIMSDVEFEAYQSSLKKENLISLDDAKKQLGL